MAVIPSNRLIDWSQCGVTGGIPARSTVYSTITGIDNTGATDVHDSIQSALNSAENFGQTVLLPAGRYRIGSSLYATFGTTLRGAGSGLTTIVANITDPIVRIDGGFWFSGYGQASLASGTGALKGATSLTLDSAPSFPLGVGVKIYIYQDNDPTEVFDGYNGAAQPFSKIQWVLVTAYDSTAKTISFTPPLYTEYKAVFNPRIRFNYSGNTTENFRTGSGVENLTIENENSNCYANVFVNWAYGCWLKGIKSKNAGICHVFSQSSLRCEIRDSDFIGVLSPLEPGRGYGIQTGTPDSPNPPYATTAMLIENNVFVGNRDNIIFGYGSSGNVVGYDYFGRTANYSDGDDHTQMPDVASHSAYCEMNLTEGCQGHAINLDQTNGNSGFNIVLRNEWLARDTGRTGQITAVELDTHNLSHTVIGNILGYSGVGSGLTAIYSEEYPTASNYNAVKMWMLGYTGSGASGTGSTDTATSLLRHGNYDYVTNSVNWDSGIADHTIPNSLYLSGQPSWWTAGKAWPPIGPDLATMVTDIPAKDRYNGVVPPLATTFLPIARQRAILSRRR